MTPCPKCQQRDLDHAESFKALWGLSEQQLKVVEGYAKSKTTKELALDMHLSEKGVDYLRWAAAKRLKIDGRDYASMARLAMKAGLIACVVFCLAATPPIPKPSKPGPRRTAGRLAVQSPKGMEVFPLAGVITNKPRALTLAWDYSFADPSVDRFKSCYWTNMVGTNAQGYKETVWPGKVLSGRVSNLVAKATYWFRVQAGATNGVWSDPSNVVTDHPTNFVMTFTYGGSSMQWATSLQGPWKLTNSVVNITNATAPRLYFRGVGATNRVAVSTMKY